MGYVRCVWLGVVWWIGGEWIGFGIYQSCGNRGSVGHVFGVWRCVMVLCRVRCKSELSV